MLSGFLIDCLVWSVASLCVLVRDEFGLRVIVFIFSLVDWLVVVDVLGVEAGARGPTSADG